MTKDEIREKVRTRLSEAGASRFPDVPGRVPSFHGVEQSAQLLTELPTWQRAKVVRLSWDAPLLQIRRAALRDCKLLYLPLPQLVRDRCIIELDPRRLRARLHSACSLNWALAAGRLIAPQEMRPVDLVVLGSVAVTRQGARVGIGGGYTDIEFAILRSHGMIRSDTPILTIVHPLQILEDRLPMRGHDIPVDFVATPTEILSTATAYPKPKGLIWEILRPARVRAIPALRSGRRVIYRSITPGRLYP